MHEWGITKSIINEIIKKSKEYGLKKIYKVCLSLGEKSDISKESLEFCFNILANGTPIEGIALEIKQGSGNGVVIDSIQGI